MKKKSVHNCHAFYSASRIFGFLHNTVYVLVPITPPSLSAAATTLSDIGLTENSGVAFYEPGNRTANSGRPMLNRGNPKLEKIS